MPFPSPLCEGGKKQALAGKRKYANDTQGARMLGDPHTAALLRQLPDHFLFHYLSYVLRLVAGGLSSSQVCRKRARYWMEASTEFSLLSSCHCNGARFVHRIRDRGITVALQPKTQRE